MSQGEPFPEPSILLPHRVAYGETDAMGQVYYAEFFEFFERARSELLRSVGLPYAEVERRGCFLPVREAQARYRKPARYDELIKIRCGVSEFSRASITMVYEILDETESTLLTTGFTQHACVNPRGRPIAVPDWLKELFRP